MQNMNSPSNSPHYLNLLLIPITNMNLNNSSYYNNEKKNPISDDDLAHYGIDRCGFIDI